MAMGTASEDVGLRNRQRVFRDRTDAGKVLGKRLAEFSSEDTIVLAIPSGGLPVAV